MKTSIIVPFYNVSEYLPSCLHSLSTQTERDFEVILVDDGSTDGSERIAGEYAAQDQRFRYLRKESGGVSSARNFGLAAAEGDLISFVDADDMVTPDYLERLKGRLLETGADLCCASHLEILSDGSEILFENRVDQDTLSDADFFDALIMGRVLGMLWNKVYKRELFEGASFPEGRCYEDIFMMNTIGRRVKKAAFLQDRLYRYYVRKSSIIHTKNLPHAKDLFEAYRQRRELSGLTDQQRRYQTGQLLIAYIYLLEATGGDATPLDREQEYIQSIPKQERELAKKELPKKYRAMLFAAKMSPVLFAKMITKYRGSK